MLRVKNKIFFIIATIFVSVAFAQHPDFKKIDSLKSILPSSHGMERINYLNAIGIEYWWPSLSRADTITRLANLAYKESVTINYFSGEATSLMLLGVAENFRLHFNNAENYLRQSLAMFEKLHDDFGVGWCAVWLGNALYGQNNFDGALTFQKMAIPFFEKLGDWEGEGKTWAWMGLSYAALGNYDSSFYYSSQSLWIRQKISDHLCVILSFMNLGQLFRVAGSYDEALDYYNQAHHYANDHNIHDFFINSRYFELKGLIYRLKNFTDSSYYFLQCSINDDSANRLINISMGETLLAKNQVDSALIIFLKPIDDFRKGNDRWDLMRVLLDAAKAYLQKHDDKKALSFALESYAIAKQSGAKQFIDESYLLLSKVYNNLHKNDSALIFLQKFTALRDTIMGNQFHWQLSNYKKNEAFKKQMEEVAVLDKENRIKEEKLKEDVFLKWILIACFIVAVLAGLIFYKNLALKRNNEKLEAKSKQAELQQHVAEVEMQALRAQMNPHFIFNCLSSINRFILKNETEAASNYLTKFSRLIRMVLISSNRSFISLEDELEMFQLYLDMEKLRFKNSFDYNITFTNSIDAGNIFVPPLLLQPFAENAIWHGLMHKEGQGHLEIKLSTDKKILICVITDNGIGRIKAAVIKSKSAEKQKSMGLQITKERLALLNQNIDQQTFFKIEDLVDDNGDPAGTKIILNINYKDLTEAEDNK